MGTLGFLPELGTSLVWCGLVAAVLAIISYALSNFLKSRSLNDGDVATRPPVMQIVGRVLFVVAALCVLGTAVVHSTLLLTHRFDINYVYRYSARGLPPGYLFATFWAGQEGSFLLWAFWTAVLGVVLTFTSGRRMEPRVMPVYGMVLGFLLVLLAAKSPFVPYAPVSMLDPQTTTPTDGIGLNPLLENPWMVIHPPTLFLGFASLAVTFSFAVASLIFGDDDHWFRRTWPWALFSFAVLGFGIMLGGYWAYETLGWGGFWGWDPVENGPLVPWLGMTAFVHSVQVQRVRGSLKKTTLFLGMFPFVLALYETFLTRTGILDKFSNHSFSTLGGVANSIILYGMLTAVVLSVGLLIWRSGKIKNESNALDDASSRDFGMTLAIVTLVACAIITGVGMSAPLITQAGVDLHIVAAQSSVQADFYNKANFPIAVILMLGMGIGPYLAWRQTTGGSLLPLVNIYGVSVLLTLAFFVAGKLLFGHLDTWYSVVLFASCVFCVIANAMLLRYLKTPKDGVAVAGGSIRTAGGALAHIGAALLLLGVVFLVAWYRSDDQTLVDGHSAQVENIPMTVTFNGTTSTLYDPKNAIKLDVLEGTGKGPQLHYVALMPVAVRDVEGQKKLLARPAIVHRWWGDLYFALKDGPEQISPTPLIKTSLAKGQTTTVGPYTLQFQSFEVPPDVAAMVNRGESPEIFPVTAIIKVTSNDGKTQIVSPKFIQNRIDPIAETSPELSLPKGKDGFPWAIAFTGMNADSGSAQFYIRDAGAPPVTAYTIEISTRPMISLVWIGTVLIALGGLISMRRRMLENRLIPVPDPEDVGAVPVIKREERSRVRARTSPIPAKGGH